MRVVVGLSFLIVLLWSCKRDVEVPVNEPSLTEVPAGFPEIEFLDSNTYSYERWELGKRLFFDPIMSEDFSISCASCHAPELAFSDDVALSDGVHGRAGTRNAPGLANVAYHPYFTREGGVPTLEMQVLVPIQEHNEFDMNILEIAERLMQDTSYVGMSQRAYGRDPDAYVITRSIAVFERTLISGNSDYDKAQNQGIEGAMTAEAKRGLELFQSERTNCSSCHGGFNFTDYSFQNNGLYDLYEDPGRYRLTLDSSDYALFKTPSLRNIELTKPYMHDGSMGSLEEVIEHYDSGGKNAPQKSRLIKPLGLSEQEKSDLLAFLKSLTDHEFAGNPKFK